MGVTAFISSFVLIFSLLFPLLGQAHQRTKITRNQVMVPQNIPAWMRLKPSNKKMRDYKQKIDIKAAGQFEVKPEKTREITKLGRINIEQIIKLSKERIRNLLGDDDGDGINNSNDNCRSTANSGQANSDGDELGNACDNCDQVSNPYQEDMDNDGIGNVCDDSDGDDVTDDEDNCIEVANANQVDVNGNGIGDECDAACPDPDFDLERTESECWGHFADECDNWIFEGSCDEGFDEDEFVVTSGHYVVAWHTEYVDYVMENCHSYFEDTTFSEDLGTISFDWDGPRPGDDEPFGFTSAILDSWWPDLELIRSAWAGSVSGDRQAGRFNCQAVAHGRCGKTVTRSFSYACLPPN